MLLLIAGCVSIKPENLKRETLEMRHESLDILRLTSHVFKATLDIKKHHLTGLLVIKRMDSLFTPPPAQKGNTPPAAPPQTGRGVCAATYRIVFVNEVGMTFFDLEMKADSFNVISCFASLNKKALMHIFETDFRILLWSGALKNENFYRQATTNNLVVLGKAGKYHAWQTYSAAGDTLYRIAARSNIADPAIITFDKYKDGFPLKIIIENPVIGMKLSFRKLVQ